MSGRVLLVEDEPALADFVVRGLREEGFAVELAIDAAEGRDRLLRENWDVVLLDWRLPQGDGLSLLQMLRQRDRTTPVLMMTARDTVADRVLGLDTGADDYLCKPFAFAELLARVRALTRRSEGRADTVLRYNDVSVDLATHRATRADQPLNLTAKEEALLVFMLRHEGRVVSRTQIYESVWDERYDGLSNTLEVHVMELRRKLEAHGPRLIHTLRGRGYLFGESPSMG